MASSCDEGKQHLQRKTLSKQPKRIVLGREAFWEDIPQIEGRVGTPLLDLPKEILDKCFGLDSSLEVSLLIDRILRCPIKLKPRDYLSLAGANRFFRHYLNDPFFEVR